MQVPYFAACSAEASVGNENEIVSIEIRPLQKSCLFACVSFGRCRGRGGCLYGVGDARAEDEKRPDAPGVREGRRRRGAHHALVALRHRQQLRPQRSNFEGSILGCTQFDAMCHSVLRKRKSKRYPGNEKRLSSMLHR